MSNFLKRKPKEPRKVVRLKLASIDLWSALKLGFLASIALGIATLVTAYFLWIVLDSVSLFASVDSLLRSVFGEVTPIVLTQEFALERVMSTAATLALVNIVINTALTVVWAGVFNVVAKLIGGVGLTFTNN